MTCFGYLRASTEQQNIDHGRAEIEGFAHKNDLGIVEFHQDEGVSGNVHWRRRRIAEVIDKAVKGDWIIVQELSRLSRRPVDILNLQELLSDKGIRLHAVKEDLTWDKANRRASSDMKTMLYAMFAQEERRKVSERVKTGIAAARLRKPFGLVCRATEDVYHRQEVIKGLCDQGQRPREIADAIGVSLVDVHNDIRTIRKHVDIKRIPVISESVGEEIKNLIRRRVSYKEIALQFNIKYWTLVAYIRKLKKPH